MDIIQIKVYVLERRPSSGHSYSGLRCKVFMGSMTTVACACCEKATSEIPAGTEPMASQANGILEGQQEVFWRKSVMTWPVHTLLSCQSGAIWWYA